MSVLSMKTWPSVGLVSPPTTLNRVVLPEPDGPMMQTYSPRWISRSMPSRALTHSDAHVVVLLGPLDDDG